MIVDFIYILTQNRNSRWNPSPPLPTYTHSFTEGVNGSSNVVLRNDPVVGINDLLAGSSGSIVLLLHISHLIH